MDNTTASKQVENLLPLLRSAGERLRREEDSSRKAGVFMGVVLVQPAAGSFKKTPHTVTEIVHCEGSIADRLEFMKSILKDIPSEYWGMVFEHVYAAKQERLDYEYSLSQEDTDSFVDVETPTKTKGMRGLIGKIIAQLKR